MSLLRRHPVATEERSLTYQSVWGSGSDVSQLHGDTVEHALRLAPVYSATSLIAGLLSTSPMAAYRERIEGVKERLLRQPQLVVNPNPCGGRIDWTFQALTSVLLTGDATGYIVDFDSVGNATKIIWLNPNSVTIIEEQNDWFHTPTFLWHGVTLDPMRVVHIPGYTLPGSVKGLSPIGLFKHQIETGLSAQDFQLQWYRTGASPSGHLKNTAQKVDAEDAAGVKARFKSAVANRDVLVTGNDWDWTALSVPGDQAQFLAAIGANATTIASIFHVSPDDIGGTYNKTLTYKTLEQDGIKMETRALAPWKARLEEAVSALLPGGQKMAIDLDALSRGTLIDRMTAHQLALNAGVETNGEARAREGRPPLTSAEIADWRDWYSRQTPVAVGADAGDTGKDDPNAP